MLIEERQEQIDRLYTELFGHTRASETLASPNSYGSHPTLSAEWLRKGEMRGALPPERRDPNGHRYYTREDIECLRNRRLWRRNG